MERKIRRVKHFLGWPIRKVNLSDDEIIDLFKVAENVWYEYFYLYPNNEDVSNSKDFWINKYAEVLAKVLLSEKGEDENMDYDVLLSEGLTEESELIERLKMTLMYYMLGR